MPSSRAIRLCPNLVFAKSRMRHYAAISKQIREIFFRFTSLVEPLALDEAFLDVGGCERLFGSAADIAVQIRTLIKSELGLVASAGVSANKFIAKVASDLEKPDGLVVVEQGAELAFLEPLKISRIWGVGKKTEQKFATIGVHTIGQLRNIPKSVLADMFGVHADHFWQLARGIDARPVVPDRIAKSISHEHTFGHDVTSREVLSAWVGELTDQVARRMRRHEIFGKTIQLKIRHSSFRTLTRSATLDRPTHATRDIDDAVQKLLGPIDIPSDGIRLVGVAVSNLTSNAPQQQLLFDQPEVKRDNRIDQASDQIKDKFGHLAIRRGTQLEHNIKHRPDPRVNED